MFSIFRLILRSYTWLFVFGFCVSDLQGQNYLIYDSIEETKFRGENSGPSVRIEERLLSLTLPIFKGEEGLPTLLGIAGYAEKRLEYSHFPTIQTKKGELIEQSDYPNMLRKISLGLGVLIPFQEDVLIARLVDTEASDGKEGSGDDTQTSAILLYGFDFQSDLSWQFGVIQSYAFGERIVLPAVGWNYQGDSMRTETLLPIKLAMEFYITDKLSFFWREEIQGGQYRLTENKPWKNSILKFSNIKSFIALGYHLKEPIILSLGFGYVSHRRWKFFDADNNAIPQGSSSLRDGKLMTLSIRLIPPRRQFRKGNPYNPRRR